MPRLAPLILLAVAASVAAVEIPPCRVYRDKDKKACRLPTTKRVQLPNGGWTTTVVIWCSGEPDGYTVVGAVDRGDFPGRLCGTAVEDTTIIQGKDELKYKKGDPCGYEAKGDPGCPGAQDR